MGISAGPRITQDSSLVLGLDASDANSNYRSDGRIWNDLSGNNNTGSIVNGVVLNNDGYGSFVFNGINNYITLKNMTSTSFTIGCWVKTTATSLAGSQAYEGNGIVWSDVSGVANDFVLAILNNRASWFTGDAGTSINGTTTINTGAWFYLTVVKNGGNSTKQLYVNAVSEGTGASSTSALTANPNISIGANSGDSRYFSGSIANVQIYNKALSATEIQNNYNQYLPRFTSPTPNVITYTSLNQATAIEVFNDNTEFANVLVGYSSYASANALALINEPSL
jgi:hypothetical protein